MYGKDINGNSIKALIVFGENSATDNPFVPILCDAIRMTGIDVRYSLHEFWHSDTAYNIIHFQWPEEVVGSDCNDPALIGRLEERIAYFRSRGAHFIYTRHNTRPNYGNALVQQAYDIIKAQSDVFVHMGHYELEAFSAFHPGRRHVVIPHHIYEYTYNESISTERARQYLNLPQDAFIITAIGRFHNRDERDMVVGAFHHWKEEKKFLLAPLFYSFSRRNVYSGNFLKRWMSRIGYYFLVPAINRWIKMRAGASDELVDDCDRPYYIAAADAVLIQQKHALNSEDVLLAFLYHKIVIGPDKGNVGELLRDTGNPVFDPDDRKDIIWALTQARRMTTWCKGEENYTYAKEHLNIEVIGQQYAQLYTELVNG